ncbi:MAG: hypothetical protein G8345_07615 [Magnetococcales bacterium]|nr:SPASM domain-containing protein [Magnetococcales bacterium]NGZ26742.1 hypothetical protein [Magnetococcales bacterium]
MAVSTHIVVRMIALHANQQKREEAVAFWQNLGVEAEIRPFFPWSEPAMAPLGDYMQNPPFMPCPFPWRYLVVQWDGTVVGCCRDYNGVNVFTTQEGPVQITLHHHPTSHSHAETAQKLSHTCNPSSHLRQGKRFSLPHENNHRLMRRKNRLCLLP